MWEAAVELVASMQDASQQATQPSLFPVCMRVKDQFVHRHIIIAGTLSRE